MTECEKVICKMYLEDMHDNCNENRLLLQMLETEPCDDAISRQAVLDIIEDRIKNGLAQNVAISQYYHMEVKKLPSVNPQEPSDISNDGTLTVNVEDGRKISRVLVCGANHWGGLYYPDEQEPKTGHWISHYDDEAKVGWYECSCCQTERAFNTSYCPDCGAKMEEQI